MKLLALGVRYQYEKMLMPNQKLKSKIVSRFNNCIYNISNLIESSLMENGSPPKLKSRGIEP